MGLVPKTSCSSKEAPPAWIRIATPKATRRLFYPTRTMAIGNFYVAAAVAKKTLLNKDTRLKTFQVLWQNLPKTKSMTPFKKDWLKRKKISWNQDWPEWKTCCIIYWKKCLKNI